MNERNAKIGSYRKVKFSMSKSSGYGNYVINSIYKGKSVRIVCHNSIAYDWLDDDSDKEKMLEARRYCYQKIKESL